MNPRNSESKMGKDKVALAICLCLIVMLAGFSAWLYVGAKGLEGKASDLESKISNLETQNAEFESKFNALESRISEQLLIVASLHTVTEPQSIPFMIMHMGTAEVTISEIRVNNALNSSSPGWVGNGTLIPGQMGQITLYGLKYFADGFTDGDLYQFEFITTRGNSFYCVVLYEEQITSPTEQLTIESISWNYNNATFVVRNTGTASLTIVEARINGVTATMNPSSVTLNSGEQATVTVTKADGFISGMSYNFAFITMTGNVYYYTAIAP
jgi:hypothetical protein